MSHVREVESWGTPQATPAQDVKPEVKPEVAIEPSKAEIVKEVVKTRNKKAKIPKLQSISVGAAAVDYSAMTSEQLRKECALQSIDWRTGGDYSRPMKKAQMLAALR